MHLLVLALGLRLAMMKFVRSVSIFYGVAPFQLSTEAWCTILGFEALCDLYAPETCHCEVFITAYLLRKTTQGTRYFVPRSGVEKVIINMVNSDHGMRDTMVQMSGPWDADSEDDRGAVPVVWNLDAGSHRRTLPTVDVEAKLRKLTAIDFNSHNWSWLLNPNRPSVPLVILRVPSSGKSQLAPEPEEPAREESNPDSETVESTQG